MPNLPSNQARVALALSYIKCQSIHVATIKRSNSTVTVTGTQRAAHYCSERVLFDDGSIIAHESRGGELTSVWAGDLGEEYIEIVHLGDGPAGGELIMTIPGQDTVLLGGLYVSQLPGEVPDSWPPAIDLAIGLMTADTVVWTDEGRVDREEIEAFHQRLLGVLHG